jgi:hypothetical protein
MGKSKHNTITEAQHGVMEELKSLMKDSAADNYDYTSAAFAATMLRPLILEHGISKFRIKAQNDGRWHNGVGVDITLTYRYMLTGAKELIEGVTYQDVQVPGAGKVGKSGDKSIFAAGTTASKYADLDFFYLPMVDDIEAFEEMAEELEKELKKGRKKLKAKDEEEEEEPFEADETEEEEEEEIPASSKDLSYKDGVLDIIEELYVEGGKEAVLEFTKGDTRNKVERLVEDLLEEEEEEEEEEKPDKKKSGKKSNKKKSDKSKGGSRLKKKKDEEEEEEEIDPEVLTDEDGYLDLDGIDYEDPKVVAVLMENIDVYDSDFIRDALETFEDPEAMKAFYTSALEFIGEKDGPDEQEAFNDEHFDTLQERFEELTD